MAVADSAAEVPEGEASAVVEAAAVVWAAVSVVAAAAEAAVAACSEAEAAIDRAATIDDHEWDLSGLAVAALVADAIHPVGAAAADF